MSARLRLFVAALVVAGAVASPPGWAASRPVLGANLDLSRLSKAQRTAALDRLAAAGVGSVRMELDWNRVEPKPGTFKWAEFDGAVASARAHSMDVVFVLGPCAVWAVNPAWQVPADEKRHSIPKSPQPWRRYVKAAAKHFKGKVRYWQVREQPNARNFRGARSEYIELLELASREVRSVDPSARIIIPESGFLDIAAVDRFVTGPQRRSADVVGVYLAADLGRVTLPWAVLSTEVMGGGATQPKPVWVLGVQEGTAADACAADYLLAWAFGSARCYLPAEAINEEWTRPLTGLSYTGFASPAPGAWLLFFSGPTGPVAAGWSLAGAVCSPPSTPTAAAGLEAAPAGEAGAAAAVPVAVQLGPRPSFFAAGPWLPMMRAGAPARADVLAARGCTDLSGVPMVYADFSMTEHPEFGLANRPLRSLGGGACIEDEHGGRSCVRTSMTASAAEAKQDNPWLYFDVDDSWLYFGRGQVQVLLTLECEGSYMGAEKLGFNIVYDSTAGYRFTPWQWVGAGGGWRSYRVELKDVSFANRDGWDFRINAKGSVQDLWVSAVTLEKAPPDQAVAAAGR